MIDSGITDEMKKKYVERRHADLAALDQALIEKDYQTMSNLGHQLKGNASTFSFDDLAAIAVALETASHAKDEKSARTSINAIRTWLARRSK